MFVILRNFGIFKIGVKEVDRILRFKNQVAVDRVVVQQHGAVKAHIAFRLRMADHRIDRGGKTVGKLAERNGKAAGTVVLDVAALDPVRAEQTLGDDFGIHVVEHRINVVIVVDKVHFGLFYRQTV